MTELQLKYQREKLLSTGLAIKESPVYSYQVSRGLLCIAAKLIEEEFQPIYLQLDIEKPNLIRRRLHDFKAKFVGRAFERTIRFDTENGNLKKQGKFLRIRTGFKNALTFKLKEIKRKFKKLPKFWDWI
jgi:hypothetical protein